MQVIEADGVDLLRAVRQVLEQRGIVTGDELLERMRLTDSASPALGARMVATAWTDPSYRELLLRDATQAAEQLGIRMRGLPPLGVLENTGDVHNLVVCTLCSCYPRGIMGYPPFWFKSAAYRSRAVRDPRGLIGEWGTVLPDDVRIRVVDSTADYRWMVLPQRPQGTDDWPADRLASLIREGDMIGVTVPTATSQAARAPDLSLTPTAPNAGG